MRGLGFFQLHGPFEELGNVGFCFVILHVLRLLVGFAATSGRHFAHDKDRKKLASYAWYSCYYCVILAWGAWLFYVDKQWGQDMTRVCEWESIQSSMGNASSLHVYHCVQVAFYLNYLFAMVTGIDVKRKDQLAFAAHHVITVLLILFSRNWGYMRIQLATLVLHDAADPFLSLAKMIKAACPTWTWLPDLLMTSFALVFYATRWVLYPLYLVANCREDWRTLYPLDWTRVQDSYTFAASDKGICIGGVFFSYYGLAMLLLYALYVLHVYWGLFILFMAHRKFTGTGSGASSTGDDNSDDEAVEKQKTQ